MIEATHMVALKLPKSVIEFLNANPNTMKYLGQSIGVAFEKGAEPAEVIDFLNYQPLRDDAYPTLEAGTSAEELDKNIKLIQEALKDCLIASEDVPGSIEKLKETVGENNVSITEFYTEQALEEIEKHKASLN